MTSSGSAWTRMRRALDHGNLIEAKAAASELDHVALSDALELVVLGAQKEPVRHARMALRWTIRYSSELHHVDPLEVQAVLALLLLLDGPRQRGALCALAGLLADRRELPKVSERLLELTERPG